MYQRCLSYGKKLLLGSTVIAPTATLFMAGSAVIAGDVDQAHAPHFHWEWEKWNKAFDTASMRRGYQVYKEVCSSCHSMKFMCYHHLVGVIFTREQAKRDAAQAMIEDGPDDEGEMFLRPGELTDVLPPPYHNEMAARAANNGSIPPDLSIIVGARPNGPNYLFSLLIGYSDEVPPGIDLAATQYFNPFMQGGAIAMPPPLNDGAVEYPDGTPATVTQMANDVTEFLSWAYWRNMNRSKQVGNFMFLWTFTAMGFVWWARRFVFAHVYAQKLSYKIQPYGFR
eukprot:CAMPEP_0202690702 /NCGR_PEP_ID=MMETSP1385-20130828/5617_1 /ASSEMBLY_ACC=CAM_ASM_000861 /TAXON_ID=933848 /ORGANISM="Elphidium margaritaceum" /LENGTH=281 /DNA_ID=CAMNT_0049345991 /DNA_START=139 /DNA_END=984 /DNA_ORIENTATION=-